MFYRAVYLIDEIKSSRVDLLRRLAELDLEAWPFAAPGEFFAMLPRLAPSIILYAADMAEDEPLRVIDALVQRTQRWPLIVIADGGETRAAVDAMKLGTLDYLQRPLAPGQPGEAIAAADGLVEQLSRAQEARRGIEERLANLTPREREVGRALLQGMGNKTAAHHLGLSVRTVEMHRSRILRKLGARNIAEGAAMLAMAEMPLDAGLSVHSSAARRGADGVDLGGPRP
jgi:two-component system response regulator FixJ